MANNLTDVIFDDSFYIGLRASIDLQYLRFRVSKFEHVVRTSVRTSDANVS